MIDTRVDGVIWTIADLNREGADWMRSCAVTTGTVVATDAERTEARAWSPLVSVSVPATLCPDLLRWEQLGAADGWRGRVVRAVFWLLRVWPGR